MDSSSSSSSSSSDDEMLFNNDDEEAFLLMQMSATARGQKEKHPRAGWDSHAGLLESTERFKSRYHMPHPAFVRLVNMIRHKITPDPKQSMSSTGGNAIASCAAPVSLASLASIT